LPYSVYRNVVELLISPARMLLLVLFDVCLCVLFQAIRYPKYGYRYLLDVLGKHYDNPLVQLYKTRFPHNNLIKDEETGMVLFKHDEYVVTELKFFFEALVRGSCKMV